MFRPQMISKLTLSPLPSFDRVLLESSSNVLAVKFISSGKGSKAQPMLQNVLPHIVCNYTFPPERSPNPSNLCQVYTNVIKQYVSSWKKVLHDPHCGPPAGCDPLL